MKYWKRGLKEMSDKTILEPSPMTSRQTVINFRDFGQIILILKKEFMSSFLATRMR